ESMNLLGDKLKQYLKDAGEKFGTENDVERLAKSLVETNASLNIEEARKKAKDMIEGKKKEKEVPGFIDSFTATFGGIGSGAAKMATGFLPGKSAAHEAREKKEKFDNAVKSLSGFVATMTSLVYTLYKKSHRLVTP
ncbi:MAG TPA: hypothetical protein VKE88_03730, partial [Candidatus Nanoarchaeia archaeon]|nr:hypothetical protein [Candidatus Nanoarchaeia archaeon]